MTQTVTGFTMSLVMAQAKSKCPRCTSGDEEVPIGAPLPTQRAKVDGSHLHLFEEAWPRPRLKVGGLEALQVLHEGVDEAASRCLRTTC
mmetsp:Transcript_42933/g.92062  ORF Transcript_42933/g.92062 Transcript_42933/m.92062 type:complete len:89 (+) Transcript_42933:414-680(+)